MLKNEILTCAAVHDISGFGKCALTVCLPVLSAMGVETSVMPTAMLSTHGGFSGFTYNDFTKEMLPMAKHWKEVGANFNSIYTGFLGSISQISVVKEIFRTIKNDDTLIMVDPVMADDGKLYKMYDEKMVEGMRELCKEADIIVPNLTEASYLTGEKYIESGHSKEYIENMLYKLSEFGCKYVVITGVSFDDEKLGSACLCVKSGEIHYSLFKKHKGGYPGTGDLFASVLLGAILNGHGIDEAQDLATKYVSDTIEKTIELKRDKNPLFGVCFEKTLPQLVSLIDN